jgi:Ca2+-transporting ATPase
MAVDEVTTSGAPTAAPVPVWHTLTVEATLAELKAGTAGLSSEESRRRLDEYGPNELQAAHRVSPWSLLLDQFKNVLVVILLVAAGLSAFMGEDADTIVIGVIVLLGVALTIVPVLEAAKWAIRRGWIRGAY